MNTLLAKINKFASHALDQILKHLSDTETFTERTAYAEDNLKHLSSGSSRIIYLTPTNEVLKLAKNERGIAQNKVESSIKSPFVNSTTKHDPNGIWKISPYLEKLTETEFEALTDIPFKTFQEILDYEVSKEGKTPKDFDKYRTNKIIKGLADLYTKHHLLTGDMTRISSWGKKDNQPVLLDAGLTRKVYEKFYTSKDKTKPPKSKSSKSSKSSS
jgi:hypothetical protein